MKEMWDERFAVPEYVYGKEPNEFFSKELNKLSPGNILLPGEGEGRNAVYAATQGWNVDAFDVSAEGRAKCLRLAREKDVDLNYFLDGYMDFKAEKLYDAIGLFFTHQPAKMRRNFHQRIQGFLKSGGAIILEGFHKKQLPLNTGGPKNLDFLYSEEELVKDFDACDMQLLKYVKRNLSEGPLHQGEAALVQVLAVKK